jgi:DNA-binding beta-propeller fold protein YncE
MVKCNLKRIDIWFYLILAIALLFVAKAHTQSATPLQLIQTIPLPDVEGRIDHMAIDLKGKRLFVVALGNNSLEILDLQAGKHIYRIRGLKEPQGVVYIPELNKIFVTNGGDGSCKIFDGDSFRLIDTVKFSDDADNIRYDPRTKHIYVGYGNGALGTIDASSGKHIGDVRLAGHPESFQLEETRPRIFVNVPTANHIAVVDRSKLAVIATWALVDARANFPMALDETNHRLFIGCRQPSKIMVYDTESGSEVTRLDIAGDIDDIFYDAAHKRIYASCGDGLLNIFQQDGAGHYTALANIPTATGARTSLLVPEQKRLYLAIPHRGDHQAEIRIYTVNP